jgi:hypothetical protein
MSHDNSIFIVVEGKVTDRYFLEKLCSAEPSVQRAGYEIYMVEQISDENGQASGGKDAVLALFDYCKDERKLAQKNSGGVRSVAFVLDRDSEHITGGKKRSPHLLYTYYADSEAHAFLEGDLIGALQPAASLDRATAVEVVNGLGNWAEKLADDWRPWIEQCYLAKALRSRTWVGFGVPHSLVHDGPMRRELDAKQLAAAKAAVRDTSLYSGAKYARIEKKVLENIDQVYASGRGYELLKGKWLASQLTGLIEVGFADPKQSADAWDNEHLRNMIAKFLLSFLDVDARGSLYIRKKLVGLAA